MDIRQAKLLIDETLAPEASDIIARYVEPWLDTGLITPRARLDLLVRIQRDCQSQCLRLFFPSGARSARALDEAALRRDYLARVEAALGGWADRHQPPPAP